jgi:hypothetical protein
MSDPLRENGTYYAKRYIFSACLTWTDLLFLRSDGAKAVAWKKAQKAQVRIHPQTWKLEISEPAEQWDKSQITSVVEAETKDAGDKTYYILITFSKGDPLSIAPPSGITPDPKKDFLGQFYCGLTMLMDHPLEGHKYLELKAKEFQQMMNTARDFIAAMPTDTTRPPIPPLPPSKHGRKGSSGSS